MSRCLVTGGAGFLGREVARTLVEGGHDVMATVQRPDDLGAVPTGAKAVVADLLDPRSLAAPVAGVEVACHCAAKLPGKGTPEEIWEVNVAGTANLVEALVAAGARRLVYVSTDSVYGDGDTAGATEDAPLDPGYLYEGNYPASKLEGERVALAAAQRHGLEVAIIRTCFMYGPGASSGGTVLRRLAAKRLHPMIDGGASLISVAYVSDVAEAVRLAAEKPEAAGRTFNVRSGTHPKREIVTEIVAATGRRALLVSLPARPLAPLATALHAILAPLAPGLARRVDPMRLRFARVHHAVDDTRIRRELGYAPRVQLREGLRRTFEAGRAR